MFDAYLLPVAAHLGEVVRGILPITLVLAAVFTFLGWIAAPCNPGHSWWRKPGLVTDFLFMFLIPLAGGWVKVFFLASGIVVFYGLTGPDDLSRFLKGGYGPLSHLAFAWQVIVYVLASDLILYWTHRVFHTRSLWHYHAIHHAPEHLDWTSATRFHPINIFFHSVLADAALMLAGISPTVLVFLAPLNAAMSAFVHANLDWTLGPFRYVIAGPVFHRWHHTDYRRGGNMNFAPTFPVIDIMFGTFYMPANELPDRFGVNDKHFPEEIVGLLLYPFRKRRKGKVSIPSAAAASTPAQAAG